MKKFGVFLLGFVVGVLATIGILYVLFNNVQTSGSQFDSIYGLTRFEQPGDTIPAKRVQVFQVLESNVALADVYTTDYMYDYDSLLVLLVGDENTSFYDDQKIDLNNKKLVQIGTYKYITKSEMQKTVPAVIISAY